MVKIEPVLKFLGEVKWLKGLRAQLYGLFSLSVVELMWKEVKLYCQDKIT